MKIQTSKPILDPCCGSRIFWFNKTNQLVVFGDKRKETHIIPCDGRVVVIDPDIQLDFTDLPFEDESFSLVVFDPPHIVNLGASSFMARKFGRLVTGWEQEITLGFNECSRVLKKQSTLIFKWNETSIPISTLIPMCPLIPLFGHRSGKQNKTIWIAFFKS